MSRAHKVVGVGNVGLYTWVVPLEGGNPEDFPVLQIKLVEAYALDRRGTPTTPSPSLPTWAGATGRSVVAAVATNCADQAERACASFPAVFAGRLLSPVRADRRGCRARLLRCEQHHPSTQGRP